MANTVCKARKRIQHQLREAGEPELAAKLREMAMAEPKRPTGTYQTAKQRQERRRRERHSEEKAQALAAKVMAAAVREGIR